MNLVHLDPMNLVHTHKHNIGVKQTIKTKGAPTRTGFAYKSALDGARMANATQGNLTRQAMQAALLPADHFKPIDVARAVCIELGLSGQDNQSLMLEAVELCAGKNPEMTLEQTGERMIALWSEYRATVHGKYKVGWRKFFADGFHVNTQWQKKTVDARAASVPDASGLADERRKALKKAGKR